MMSRAHAHDQIEHLSQSIHDCDTMLLTVLENIRSNQFPLQPSDMEILRFSRMHYSDILSFALKISETFDTISLIEELNQYLEDRDAVNRLLLQIVGQKKKLCYASLRYEDFAVLEYCYNYCYQKYQDKEICDLFFLIHFLLELFT